MISFLDFERMHGCRLTTGQAALASVAFDRVEPCKLQGAERDAARQLFGPTVEVLPASARGVLVLLKGARIGGSMISGHYSLWRALTADLSRLAPGERATALIVGPELRLARQTMRFALGVAKSLPDVNRMIESETSDGFVLRRPDGARVAIECLPATRGGSALRGRTLVSVVFSEAAFFRDENSTVNDTELFRAAAPRVLPGGMVVLESTPWSESGLVYDLFTANHDKPSTSIAALAPTLLMRTDPETAAVVAREVERDPIAARQEFFAEFMTSGAGAFFDGQAVAACVDKGRFSPLPPRAGARAFAAMDLGFSSDHSAITVVRIDFDADVVALADWLEIAPRKGQPLKPSNVAARFAAVAKNHSLEAIVGDGHYRESMREHLDANGVRFVPAEAGITGKLKAYRLAQALIRENAVSIPNLPRLVQQLREVQVKPLAGGNLQISHPRRSGAGHGDLSAAFVLALAAAAPHMRRGRLGDRGAVGARNFSVLGSQHGSSELQVVGTDVIIGKRPAYSIARNRMGGF